MRAFFIIHICRIHLYSNIVYNSVSLKNWDFTLEINTTLLREKFIIRDMEREGDAPIVAVSNRLSLPLYNISGDLVDTLVIRSQNMHHCIRMSGHILRSFINSGPLFSRNAPYDFQEAWDKCLSVYDASFTINKWIAIYHKGKDIFSAGTYHPFLDIVEKCDSKNPNNYDQSIKIAEDAFKKMGREVSISYEANIGMVISTKSGIGRCGLIHRGAEKNATFNFSVSQKEPTNVLPVYCLNIGAAFLEGLQLSYTAGIAKDKKRLLMIEKYSLEEKQLQAVIARIGELNLELKGFENRLSIKFRPEKPEFSETIRSAERFHRKMYESKNQ